MQSLLSASVIATAASLSIGCSPPDTHERPLEPLSHLVGGSWRMGAAPGRHQTDTWRWGPGGHTLIATTTNSESDGQTTAGIVRVVYPSAGDDGLAYFALSVSGIMKEGSVHAEGDVVTFDMDIHYPESVRHFSPNPVRPMRLRWEFASHDAYRSALLEAGGDGSSELAAWEYVRIDPDTEPEPLPVHTLAPDGPLDDFLALLGKEWAVTGGDHQLSVREIAHAQAVHIEHRTGADLEPVAETIVYHHPITDEVLHITWRSDGTHERGAASVESPTTLRLDDKATERARVFGLTEVNAAP